jgi:hypothetical protein
MATKETKQLVEASDVGGGATGVSMAAAPTTKQAAAPGNSKKNSEPMPKGQNPAGTPIDETDPQNNTLPTGDTSAMNAQSISAKPSAASAAMESVEEMFGGDQLSEEFKERAAVIFEAAVAAKVAEHRQSLEEEYQVKLEESLQQSVADLTEKLDTYLDYVAQQFMQENQIAIEQSLRTEITEEFVESLGELFALHNINLPDEQVNVVEQLAAEIQELEAKLNETVNENIELYNAVSDYTKNEIFSEVAEGLADTQVEKLASLAEGVEFENADSYKKKLEIVKETFFNADKKPARPAVLNEEIDPVEDEAVQPATGAVAAYVNAISRTVKK